MPILPLTDGEDERGAAEKPQEKRQARASDENDGRRAREA